MIKNVDNKYKHKSRTKTCRSFNLIQLFVARICDQKADWFEEKEYDLNAVDIKAHLTFYSETDGSREYPSLIVIKQV